MDNFLLQAVVNELEGLLVGHRAGKVHQLGNTGLALDFHLRDDRRLIVSTDPQSPALYLSRRAPKQFAAAARTDTAFVALYKKYLGGARLLSIAKLGYDRVVNFAFEAEDENGQTAHRRLIVLLTGRSSNVLLLDDERVIATLRERAEPTETYVEPPPPPDKLDPFLCTPENIAALTAAQQDNLAVAAQRSLLGFTQLYALELAARAQTTDAHQALHHLLAELETPTPTIYSSAPLDELHREPGRADFALQLSPVALTHLAALTATRYPTVNEAADAYFTLLDAHRSFLASRQQLTAGLAARLKKQRALAANLSRERAGFSQAETHQRCGELLLANLHQIVEVERGFQVTDFYDESQPTVIIPAADKASARAAAAHYFKLARKARNGLKAIAERLPPVELEITQLETQLARLATVTRRDELHTLTGQTGVPTPPKVKPPTAPRGQAKAEKISGVRRYRATDGYEMLVGRTDRDNDTLTFRVARSFDLWFHAADYPGSHVVLRNPTRQPVPHRAIVEAAQLAAKFSQARADSRVAVNYCERKFVTKLKGFAPGQVRLASFKTVLVEPAEAGERIID